MLPALLHVRAQVEGLALPKSFNRGSLGFNRLVIQWMSDEAGSKLTRTFGSSTIDVAAILRKIYHE